MNYTEQRQYYRSLLNGTACVSPASVYDALSARVAESVGYRLGILAGSVASQTTIAAPDIVLLTLTELADQVRRIMRTSTLSLMVDADHGFGNALNVMRTVQELEHAGAAACSIEDTVLPASYGAPTDSEELISTEEMLGKLRAALAARTDPTFVVLGRTSALRAGDTEGAIARAKAYAATGVDAIFLVGARSLDQIAAVHQASGLPVVIGAAPASLTHADLAAHGGRILLQGHQPIFAAVKALRATYQHLYDGGAPADLRDHIASGAEMDALTSNESHKAAQQAYLGGEAAERV